MSVSNVHALVCTHLYMLDIMCFNVCVSVCVSQGFGDGSILPEDLRQEQEEEEEPELILDGGLPRYASPLTSNHLGLTPTPTPRLSPSPLLPGEDREMAVDDDDEEEEEDEVLQAVAEVEVEESEGERAGSYPRKAPPSWQEWERSLPAPLPTTSSFPEETEQVSDSLVGGDNNGTYIMGYFTTVMNIHIE